MATFLERLFLGFAVQTLVLLVGQVTEPFRLAQSPGNTTGVCDRSQL